MENKEQGESRPQAESTPLPESSSRLEAAEHRIRELERSLGRSEERFAALFRESSICKLLADPAGNFTGANPAALRMLGIPNLDTVRRFNLFQDEQWTAEARAQLREGSITGVQTVIDFDEIRRRGLMESTRSGKILVDWVVAPLGESGYLVQLQDVTAKVHLEQEAAARARLFRETFAVIPYPTLMWKRRDDGRLVLELFNKAAGAISQGRLIDFLGATIDEFYEHNPSFPERVKQTLETGETLRAEMHYHLRTTGQPLWIVTTSARVDEDRVLDSMLDISNLKQAEEARRRSEENYRRIVQTAHEGILVVDNAARITYLNARMAAMLASAEEELLGSSIYQVVRPESAAELSAALECADNPGGRTVELEFLLPDQASLWALLSITPIVDEPDTPAGNLLMVTDITDRIQMERALRSSLQEKELLLREIHHRVKNNLAIVSSLLDLQAMTVGDAQVSKRLREGQSRILSVASLHEILYQSVDLGTVAMDHYLQLLGEQIAETMGQPKGLTQYRVASAALPIEKAVHWGLIVNELLTNVYKHAFGPEDRDRQITLALHVAGDGYHLEVADNGRGMPAGFDPQQSTSLGTQIVLMLAEQLGGRVDWTSPAGLGTRAIVHLPAQEPAA